MTIKDIERNENLAWGPSNEVRDRLLESAESVGANILLISFNRGAMPNDMFMEQLRRFGKEVLPDLQAHEVKSVPLSH